MTPDPNAATGVQRTLLPPSYYSDPAIYERERTSIFAREWTYVADVSQLAGAGDYVATTVAGYPLLVINDGVGVRGFHNVCRHRGGPLAWDAGDQSRLAGSGWRGRQV